MLCTQYVYGAVLSQFTATAEVDERRQIAFLLSDAVRLLRRDFAERAQGLGLTPALHRLLFYVQRSPGCPQVELADWLDIKPVTVGRMIDRLETQRLVRRESDPDDRRVSRIYLEEAAEPLMAQLKAHAALSRERAFCGFAPAERQALLGALERVRDNLSTDAARHARSKGSPHGR